MFNDRENKALGGALEPIAIESKLAALKKKLDVVLSEQKTSIENLRLTRLAVVELRRQVESLEEAYLTGAAAADDINKLRAELRTKEADESRYLDESAEKTRVVGRASEIFDRLQAQVHEQYRQGLANRGAAAMIEFSEALGTAIEKYSILEAVHQEAHQRFPRGTKPEPPALFFGRTFGQLGGDGGIGLAFLQENAQYVPAILQIPVVARVIAAAHDAESRRRAERRDREAAWAEADRERALVAARLRQAWKSMDAKFIDDPGARAQASLNPAIGPGDRIMANVWG